MVSVQQATLAALILSVSACASSHPVRSPKVTPATSCATGDNAYVSIASLAGPGAFDALADQRFAIPPLEGQRAAPASSSMPAISEWRAGRLRGWIADISVTGPDRPSEDQYAHSLGYAIGHFPLVPLVGPVVEHNSGVLDLYQTNTEYVSVSGADDYMRDLEASALQAETGAEFDNGVALPRADPLHVWGGDARVGYEVPQHQIANVGPTERSFILAVRLGRYVVQLSVQGGDSLDSTTALRLLNGATAGLTQSCGLTSVTFHVT